jgi:hypothetical protein
MRTVQVGIASGLALALVLGTVSGALAVPDGDDLVERTNTTYRLLPDQRVIHVESSLDLTNKRKPVVTRGPCKNGRGTCKFTTRWYYETWHSWWTPANVLNAKVSGPKVTAEPVEEAGAGLRHAISYPKLWNKKGARQKAAFSFDIPAGSVLSPDDPTRIEDGYAHFCYWGMDSDTGTTRAVLPPGWEPVGRNPDVAIERTDDGVVLKAKREKEPSAFIYCLEAVDVDRLDQTYVTGEAGKSLIVIEGWPNDAAWAEDMRQVAAEVLPRLEALMGTTMPGGELRVREVATQARPFVYGDLRPVDGVLGMGEDADARRFLPSRLARMWIDPAHFTDRWLAEGLSIWLSTQVLDGASCIPPGAHPGPGTPDLDTWTEVTSTGLIPLGNWQQDTACSLVAAGAEIIGTERMVELANELIAAPVPVGTNHWLAGVSRELPAGLDGLVAALDGAGIDH